MLFEDRIVQHAGRKKITKLSVDPDDSNIIYADIERHEGDVDVEGTSLNAKNLNKGNWRDDKSLSFKAMEPDEEMPNNLEKETQIITNDDGEIWVLPPAGKFSNFKLGESIAMDGNTISGMPIGTIFSAIRADLPIMNNGLPVGCVRLDGSEYNRVNFPDFYDMAVVGKFGPTKSLAEYDNEFTANGNCGYIGLDTTSGNEKFKVPKLMNGMVIANGSNGNIGEYSKGGLPNITGSLKLSAHDTDYYASTITGAINETYTIGCYNSDNTTGSGSHWGGFNFDASASSPIYSNDNTTVIPNHIKYPYFMVIANSIPEASQAVWDDFVGNLSNKTNLDLMNTTENVDIVVASAYNLVGSNYFDGWWRKWKSGWVEQGGRTTINERANILIDLPLEMTNTQYTVTNAGNTVSTPSNAETISASIYNESTTQIRMTTAYIDPNTINVSWEVKGKGV